MLKPILVIAGAAAVAVIALASTMARGPAFVAGLQMASEHAREAAGGQGIAVRFVTPQGWLTRHALLSGGEALDPTARARAAAAVAATPGVGGARWGAGLRGAVERMAGTQEPAPMHCQQDVEGILHVRSIRFGGASAAIDPTSNAVLDEVAGALEPCVGSIIAITGHTDAGGNEGRNLALSRRRAEAVRNALIGRGIPADGLRASGMGSLAPVEDLEPNDPANRRIDFSVVSTLPAQPTPVDTPGPG